MSGLRDHRRAFAIFELLTGLAVLVLIAQLLGRALDPREWSRTTWFALNLLFVVGLLLFKARQSREPSESQPAADGGVPDKFRRAWQAMLVGLLFANVAVWQLGWSKLGQWSDPFHFELAKFEQMVLESEHRIESCPQPVEPIDLKLTLQTKDGLIKSCRGRAVENFYGPNNDPPERMSRSMEVTSNVLSIQEDPWLVEFETRRLTTSKFGTRGDEARWVPSFGSRDTYKLNSQYDAPVIGEDAHLYVSFVKFPSRAVRVGESWLHRTKVPQKAAKLVRQNPPHCECTLQEKVLFDQREAVLIECAGQLYRREDEILYPVKVTAKYYVDLQTGVLLWHRQVWRWRGNWDDWREEIIFDSISS